MATQAAVDSLTDMGFGPPEKARKALTISKGNIEAAIEWFVANPDLVVGPNEDDGAEEMSLADPSSVLDAAVQGGVVRSYKCVETGRLFATMADVELYSERTGRTNFEETTEEKKPKTKEEIAEAQEKLKIILNEKRAKREEEEKKRHREEELRRREAGKTMGQTREELEKIKRKREWEKQKKEKQAAKMERERLRREIAKDKAERLARGGKLAGKLSVDGYAPAGQDVNSMSRDIAAMENKRKQEEQLQKAGVRKAPVKDITPDEMATKSVGTLSMLKAAGVGQTALKTAAKMLGAILKKPEEPKFRRINLANENFLKRLGGQPGGVTLLRSAGFVKNVEENVLEMSDSDAQNCSRIEMVVGKINEKIVQ